MGAGDGETSLPGEVPGMGRWPGRKSAGGGEGEQVPERGNAGENV